MLKKVLLLSVIFLLLSSTCFAFEVNVEEAISWIDKGIAFFNEQIVPLWNKLVAWGENNLSDEILNEIKREAGEVAQEVPILAKEIWNKILELIN